MVFWSLVFTVISFILIIGNFFNFPIITYQYFPIITLLGALGLLYRTLTMIKKAEKEQYIYEIEQLRDELDNYRRRIIRGETEIITSRKSEKG